MVINMVINMLEYVTRTGMGRCISTNVEERTAAYESLIS